MKPLTSIGSLNMNYKLMYIFLFISHSTYLYASELTLSPIEVISHFELGTTDRLPVQYRFTTNMEARCTMSRNNSILQLNPGKLNSHELVLHLRRRNEAIGFIYNIQCKSVSNPNLLSDVVATNEIKPYTRLRLSNHKPLGKISETTGIKLSLSTDRKSTCRYSNRFREYESMSPLNSIDLLNHEQSLKNIKPDSDYSFFVSCKDNENNDFILDVIAFSTRQGGFHNSSPDDPYHYNDPLKEHAWHLDNRGQFTFSNSGGIAGKDMRLISPYVKGLTGKGVRVAVSDTGLQLSHEDLVQNILFGENRNYLAGSTKWISHPYQGDVEEHATAVSGIIAAVGNNKLGSHGVAPNAKIAGFNYLSSEGELGVKVDQASGDFDIFNYSYGYPQVDFSKLQTSEKSQYAYAVKNGRNGKGSIFVKSSGNAFSTLGNANFDETNTIPEIMVVGAVNANGVASSYSSPGSNLWLSAPGGEFGTESPAILTTDLSGCKNGYSKKNPNLGTLDFNSGANENKDCNYTSKMNGTSSAAPNVTGVVALLLEANPKLTWREIKHILAVTATKTKLNDTGYGHPSGKNLAQHTYQEGWVKNASGYLFNNRYGFGVVDATRAVNFALQAKRGFNGQSDLVVTNWNDKGTTSLPIPDNSKDGATYTLDVSTAMFIEAFQIKVNVTHTKAADLGIEVTSPSGTKSILLNINSNIKSKSLLNYTLSSNAFYMERSKGKWKIKIIDGAPDNTGVLNSIGINFYGQK